ncbi:Uncharacterised protein [Segatella copri]|nr:Uncharacterised protein [Segatella copri]
MSSISFSILVWASLHEAAISKFWFATACCFLLIIFFSSFSSLIYGAGTLALLICTREPASSITSIALSGKWRSVI